LLKSPIRVLIVDDFEAWRRFHCSAIKKHAQFQIIGEVSDGLEAVQQARQLQPDLIVLDIGLPTLNGIEAARQIRNVSPASKILFVSENRSDDIVEAALNAGGQGYVLKSDAAGELLSALRAVLEGKRFISASLAPLDPQTGARFHGDNVTTLISKGNAGSSRRHEVGFYSEDCHFLADVTRFIAAALGTGNAAIVIATELHRESLLLELKAADLDIATAIHEGRYVSLDAADVLMMFMHNGVPDPVRFLESFGDLIVRATEAAKGEHPCVSVFGECVSLLWAAGHIDAAIQMEKLANHLAKIHSVTILCGYSLSDGQERMDDHLFQQICAEHTAHRSR